MPIRLVAAKGSNLCQLLLLDFWSSSYGSIWLICDGGKSVDVFINRHVSQKIVLQFSSGVRCACSHVHASSYNSTAVFFLMDSRILSLSIDLVLNGLCRNLVSGTGITCGLDEDIFGSSLAPVSSKPIFVLAEPFCNVIGCYENSVSFASLNIIIVEEAMLIQLHSSIESVICGYYSSVSLPDRYCDGYIISKELSESFISSFIVLCNNHKEASSDSPIIFISNHIMISYFGLDVSSKSSILLYGTSSTNGDVFYTVLPSADQCVKNFSLKSYLLLSMSQTVIKVLPFRFFTDYTEVGANSLFFIGKEGKICVLFSSGKSKDCKDFFLNVPVYSACFLKHYLLISSYKEIIVINLECKDDNIKETLCISALLVKAFCNPHILKINSVMKMFVDTRRSIVLLVKRNGYIYALDEVDLASTLLSPFLCNLQGIVSKFCKVSDEVDLFKDSLSTTEHHLKQINNAIKLYLNVNLKKEDNSLITCSLLPVTYVCNKGDLSVKLEFKCLESQISCNVYVSMVASSKYTYRFLFYSLSKLAQDEMFPQNLMLSIKDLPFQVTWNVYCDFTTIGLFNVEEIVSISSVIKQENFNVLDFLKELDLNVVQQDQFCNIEGCLTLSKQSWEMLKNISWTKLSLDKLFCIASETSGLQFALFASCKENIMHIGHLEKISEEDYVIARLFTNSAPFACEMRAEIIKNLELLQGVSSSQPGISYHFMGHKLQNASSKLHQIGDELVTIKLDRVNSANQLFNVYLHLYKM